MMPSLASGASANARRVSPFDFALDCVSQALFDNFVLGVCFFGGPVVKAASKAMRDEIRRDFTHEFEHRHVGNVSARLLAHEKIRITALSRNGLYDLLRTMAEWHDMLLSAFHPRARNSPGVRVTEVEFAILH